MNTPRIMLALAVAALADALQLPANAAVAGVVMAVPGEIVLVMIDCIAMFIESRLLGFHWLFLPSFLAEAVPGLGLFPTWSATIAYVTWRNRQHRRPKVDAGAGQPFTRP